jgi:hypothetical protein
MQSYNKREQVSEAKTHQSHGFRQQHFSASINPCLKTAGVLGTNQKTEDGSGDCQSIKHPAEEIKGELSWIRARVRN